MTVCFNETRRARDLQKSNPERYEDMELEESRQVENVESFVEGDSEYILCRKFSAFSDYEVIRIKKEFYHLAFVTCV